MAEYKLPAATSVVNFLNSSKQDSSFSARSKLYAGAGIDKRLGAFTGSSAQNMALLDHLKAGATPPAASPTPNAAAGIITSAKTSTPATAAPFSPLTQVKPSAAAPIDFSKLTVKTPTATDTFNFAQVPGAGGKPVDFSKLTVAPATPPAISPSQVASTIAPSTPAPSTQGSAAVTETNGNTALFESIAPGSSTNPSEGDLIQQFLASQEGLSLLDKQERGELDAAQANAEAKRLLELKYAGDRSALESSLASHGLAFSGIRNTQLKALIDNLGASELNLDRQLASKLLDSNATLRDGIIKGVNDLFKAAADKSDAAHKEAIQQLNAVGLAIVGDKVVPTLAAKNADRAAAQQEIANARAQANYELSERRLQLSEEAANRAEARFQQLYGAGKREGFDYARQLFALNPTATPAELRVALLEDTDMSSTEIESALKLIGVPKGLQSNVAIGYVKSAFKSPGISKLLPGDQTAKALEAAKAKAISNLNATGGTIQLNTAPKGETPKYVTYEVTSDQITALGNLINTVTIDDIK